MLIATVLVSHYLVGQNWSKLHFLNVNLPEIVTMGQSFQLFVVVFDTFLV